MTSSPIIRTTVTADSAHVSTSGVSKRSYTSGYSSGASSSSYSSSGMSTKGVSPKSVKTRDFPVSQPNNDEKIKSLLSKSLSEREEEKKKYEDIIYDLEQENERLKNEYQNFKKDYDELLRRIEESDADLKKLKKQIAQMSQLERENAQLKQENQTLISSLDAQKELSADAEREKIRLQGDLRKAEDSIRDLQRQLNELKERDRRYQQELAALKAERDDALRKAQGVSDLQRKIAAAEDEIQRLKQINEEQAQQVQRGEQTVRELQQRVQSLADELARLRQDNADAIAKLEAALRQARQDADRAIRAAADKDREIAALTAERDNLKRLLADAQSKIPGLQSENRTLSEQLTVERQARELAEQKQRDAERERDKLAPRIPVLEKELQRIKDEYARTRGGKERDWADRERALTAQLQQLKKDQAISTRAAGDLLQVRAELETAINENQRLQAELLRVTTELTTLQTKITKDKEKRPKVINIVTQVELEPEDEI